jgi:NAD(P)-dependent dehydrogenase (short-subunit alcohol dehydrogenase family)
MHTVLITGAGRGIGLEFARQYANDGWRVIGTVRDAGAAARVKGLGGGVEVHSADVGNLQSIRTLAATLRDVPIDVLICNALDYPEWEEMFRVNTLGAAATAEALVPNVAAGKRKVIVMMSSRLGSIAESRGNEIAYASSKAALNAVMRAFALQMRNQAIIVISVSPGWVRTDMGGEQASLSPEQSVSALRNVIASLTLEDSGRFYSLEGQQIPF